MTCSPPQSRALGVKMPVGSNLYSSDTFYDAAGRNARFGMGILAVEMEAAGLYAPPPIPQARVCHLLHLR